MPLACLSLVPIGIFPSLGASLELLAVPAFLPALRIDDQSLPQGSRVTQDTSEGVELLNGMNKCFISMCLWILVLSTHQHDYPVVKVQLKC